MHRRSRLLHAVIAATAALALSGGPSVALAMSAGAAPHAQCPRPVAGCHEQTFKCACCLDDGGGAPAPGVPAPDRPLISKTTISSGVVPLIPAAVVSVRVLRVLHAPSTHRAGPPSSLSLLHASLLL